MTAEEIQISTISKLKFAKKELSNIIKHIKSWSEIAKKYDDDFAKNQLNQLGKEREEKTAEILTLIDTL